MSQRRSFASQSTSRSQPSQQSQSSELSPSQQSQQISPKESQSLARDVVRYILMQDYNKHPVKDLDIKNNVLRTHKRHSRDVMDAAKKILREVYGMDIIEIMQGTVKQYFVVNKLEHQEHVALPTAVHQELGLLTIVLSFIFMATGKADGAVDSGKLSEFLNRFDVGMEEQHPVFGDTRKLFENFRSQRYLNCIKVPGSDPPRYEYEWGDRAKKEISLRNVLAFVSEMCNVDDIEKWTAHYEEVQEQENRRIVVNSNGHR